MTLSLVPIDDPPPPPRRSPKTKPLRDALDEFLITCIRPDGSAALYVDGGVKELAGKRPSILIPGLIPNALAYGPEDTIVLVDRRRFVLYGRANKKLVERASIAGAGRDLVTHRDGTLAIATTHGGNVYVLLLTATSIEQLACLRRPNADSTYAVGERVFVTTSRNDDTTFELVGLP